MCVLLKLDYAKFEVSNLIFSNVIEEKLLGVGSTPPPPPLVNEGLKMKDYDDTKDCKNDYMDECD